MNNDNLVHEAINEHLREDLNKNPDAYSKKAALIQGKLDFIEKLTTIHAGMTFLDVGSGSGLTAIYAAEKGLESFGIEILPKAIEIAKKNAELKKVLCDFRSGEAEVLPYPDNYFDIVFCNSVLEHVKNYEKSLGEMVRVLKENGVLFIETTNRQYPFTDEIQYFPLFPYYPNSIRQRIIKWATKKKPELIGNMPSSFNIIFHSFSKIKGLLEKLNCEVYDVLDLYEKEKLKGFKKILRPFWKFNKNKLFRWVLHFFMPCIELYAIKR